jgi:hypothetical protein
MILRADEHAHADFSNESHQSGCSSAWATATDSNASWMSRDGLGRKGPHFSLVLQGFFQIEGAMDLAYFIERTVAINSFEDMRSDYVLKRAYDVDLSNDDYDVDTNCTCSSLK